MFFLLVIFLSVACVVRARDPFLITIDNQNHIIGNDIWNVTVGPKYGTKLFYKGIDLVGNATGHYVSYSKSTGLQTIRYIS
jgi:rhamnogalacturonan endolyase